VLFRSMGECGVDSDVAPLEEGCCAVLFIFSFWFSFCVFVFQLIKIVLKLLGMPMATSYIVLYAYVVRVKASL
jgi:hypothetical protein